MPEQLSITGDSVMLTPNGFTGITRRTMHEKPVTYLSHRLLMIEIAKQLGFDWNGLPRDQQRILERLFDHSPDIERAARKVREEDTERTKVLTRTGDQQLSADQLIMVSEPDPFDEIEKESEARERQRKRWRR